VRDPRFALPRLVGASAGFAVVALDPAGTIFLWNDGARAVFGRTAEEMVGTTFPTGLAGAGGAAGSLSPLEAALERARSDGSWSGVVPIPRPEDRTVSAYLEVTRLGRDPSTTEGVLLVGRDVTDDLARNDRLARSEAHYRELVESDADAVAVTDTLGVITEVNHRMEELAGGSALEGTRWADLFLDPKAAERGFHQVLVDRRATGWGLVLASSTGAMVPVDVSASAFGTPSGGLGGVVLRLRDVTERTVAEAHLRESQVYNRGLIEASIDALFAIDPEGTITDLNRQSEVVIGFSRDQILGTKFSEYFTDAAAATSAVAAILATGSVANLVLTLRPQVGPPRAVSVNASVFHGELGEARGIFAAARDITEQTEAEARLRASQNYHRSLIEASPDVMMVVDSAMTIADVNEQTVLVTGLTREELVGSGFRDLFTDPRRAVMGVQETLANGSLTNYELTFQLRSGHELLVSASASVLRSPEGQVQGVVLVARDRTAQRALEQRLREARNYNRGLIEASLDGLVTVNPELAITDVNEQMVHLSGLPRRELLGSRFPDLFDDPDRATNAIRLALDRQQVTAAALTLRRRNRPGLPVSVNAGTFTDTAGAVRGVLVAARDFTEHKRLESELREVQSYSRSLIESNIDALVTTDLLGRITDVNQEMENLAGRTRDALIGTPFRDHVTDPASADDVLRRALADRRVTDLEFAIRHATGVSTPVSCNAAIFLDTEGRLKGVVAAVRDITEPRRLRDQLQLQNRELLLQNQRVLEANRLKSEFLASMSHELRTPLNSIIGFSDFLLTQESSGLSAEAREYLGDILAGGNHLLQLINDVLDLAKVEAGKMEVALAPFSPRHAIDEVMTSVRPMAAEKRIVLTLRDDGTVPSVTLDPLRFKQILYNLLSNAIKFTNDGGAAEVVLAARGSDGFTLSVRDTGIGIAPEDVPRLFREFEQLESGPGRRFGGSGLGLSLTKKLVELLEGTIEVESAVGAGTMFSVRLPRGIAAPQAAPPETGGT
jgi:PAS domain S-box-containing protein